MTPLWRQTAGGPSARLRLHTPTSKSGAWPMSLVRAVDLRLRRLRRQERGETVTPEAPARGVATDKQTVVPLAGGDLTVQQSIRYMWTVLLSVDVL